MSDILIRDVDPVVQHRLKERAAHNGRSQQKEAKAILEEALAPQRSWVRILYDAARSVGGIELELPERHPAREIDTSNWV